MKIISFDWDERNIDHIARHNITPDEAEEAFLDALFRKGAYSGGNRTPIPIQTGHSFQSIPDTHSEIIRTVIPKLSGHRFRFYSDTFGEW